MDTIVTAIITTLGLIVVAVVSALHGKAVAKSEHRTTVASIKVQAENNLIDQLQEELRGYRAANDSRVANLETQVRLLEKENRGYRAFIGVQRDHMTTHHVPLPPWPKDLPR